MIEATIEPGPPGGPALRLDRALVRALELAGHEVSRSRLERAFAAGGVRSAGDGRVLKASSRVDRPLVVRVELEPAAPLRAEAEDLDLRVLYEDEHLLVIDKPAHMPVHAGPGHAQGTLVNAVLFHLGVGAGALPCLPGNESHRPGIVHRLDRDTSGVMVVARRPEAMTALARRFEAHDIERVYLGIVSGSPRRMSPGGSVKIVTGHARDARDRRRFTPVALEPGVRQAVTVARLERAFGQASLLSFRLETGRTHQIRMHARHLGHPILGDELYGHRPREAPLADWVREMGRQALHAAVLGFEHPATGQPMRFEAPLPPELRRLVERLSAHAAGAASSA